MPKGDSRPRNMQLAGTQLDEAASSAATGWKDPTVSKVMAKNRDHSYDVAVNAFDTASAQQKARAKAKFKDWQSQ